LSTAGFRMVVPCMSDGFFVSGVNSAASVRIPARSGACPR
jgi:hypothetical protein